MVEFAVMASCTLGDEPHVVSPGPADWQSVLAESVRSPAELCRLLGLEPALAAEAERAAGGFPLLVPRPYLARIRPGDPADPLLLQVLPRAAETAAVARLRRRSARRGRRPVRPRSAAEVPRPNLDGNNWGVRRPLPILLPAALSVSSNDGPLCRRRDWEPALRSIAADRSIHEVILSGGDPLTLPDAELARLADQLAEIPHLRRLRIHTRLPVMIPQRVTDELIAWLRGSRLSPIMVVHVNHPAEIDADVAAAFGRLVDAGIPRAEPVGAAAGRQRSGRRAGRTVRAAGRSAGDAVLSASIGRRGRGGPFRGARSRPACALMAELRARLPGYAVPRYVRETRAEPARKSWPNTP